MPTVSIEGRVSVDLSVQFGGGRGGRGGLVNQGPAVQGTFGGLAYRATIRTTDPDGNFKVEVPKGLSDVVIDVDLSNPFPGARGRGFAGMQGHWRLGSVPLQNTSKIRLGTLEKDFRDLEIVYTRDANANVGSQAALVDAQLQSLQAAVQSGQLTAEQAAEMQQVLLLGSSRRMLRQTPASQPSSRLPQPGDERLVVPRQQAVPAARQRHVGHSPLMVRTRTPGNCRSANLKSEI